MLAYRIELCLHPENAEHSVSCHDAFSKSCSSISEFNAAPELHFISADSRQWPNIALPQVPAFSSSRIGRVDAAQLPSDFRTRARGPDRQRGGPTGATSHPNDLIRPSSATTQPHRTAKLIGDRPTLRITLNGS